MAKWNEWKAIFHLHLRALRDTERYVPGRTVCMVLTAIVSAVSPYLTIWLSAQVINELASLRRPGELMRWALWTVGVTAAVGILKAILRRWLSALNTLHNPMKERIYMEKFLSMDYAHIDSQRIRDLKAQVDQFQNWMGWGMNAALNLTHDLLVALFGILSAIALTVSLFTQTVPDGPYSFLDHPVSMLALIAVMALTTWLGGKLDHLYNSREVALAEEATLGNRMYSVYMSMCQEPHRRLDIRTYNQQDATANYLSNEAFSPCGSFHNLAKGRYGVAAAVGRSLGAVFTGFVYVFTCLKAWAGAFSVGSVTQYVGAVTALSKNLGEVFAYLDRIRHNHQFLKLTYELLDTKNEMYQGSLTTEKRSDRQYQVEFRDVSFKYPGSDTWALRHVNMKFQVGRRLAIVGENGSGKTTFIKLLCRLYDPQEGQILLNGIDIRKYRYDDYMNIFSVVFQDFQLICQPLGANVAGRMDYDRDRARAALRDAGFPEWDLDTMIYKDLGDNGVTVSGGEAQKIAIARALYKDAPFIILDEPTATLDPIAEAEIYAKFNDIAGDKTAIYISHRLSSCKFCDEIAVFHQGAVVQQDSHEGLLADTSGKYHQLWNAQAQYYTE